MQCDLPWLQNHQNCVPQQATKQRLRAAGLGHQHILLPAPSRFIPAALFVLAFLSIVSDAVFITPMPWNYSGACGKNGLEKRVPPTGTARREYFCHCGVFLLLKTCNYSNARACIYTMGVCAWCARAGVCAWCVRTFRCACATAHSCVCLHARMCVCVCVHVNA